MLPLEAVFALIVIIWAMIGSVRGFAREIGSSIAILLAMAVLRIFGPMIITTVNKFAGKLTTFKIETGAAAATGADQFCASPTTEQFVFYSITFAVIVYMGYQGDTLGLDTKFGRAGDSVLGLFVGVANGYLIAGNLWYFLDKCAQYVLPMLGNQSLGVLSPNAQLIIKVLPLNLIGDPVLLIGVLFLLMILRIAK